MASTPARHGPDRLRARRRSRALRRAASAWLLVLACGCYEIPPTLPPNYIDGGGEDGWPPLRVYHFDPFHPANVLFQRLFQLDCGELRGDVPVAERGEISAADRSEIPALLDELESAASPGSGAEPLPPRGLALLRGDLENVKRRFREGPEAERELAARIDATLGKIGNALLSLPPPPRGALRSLPSGLDVGHPRPAGGELEAWALDGDRVRVLRLERARWLRGEEPWRELGARERLGVRRSAGAARELAFDSMARLCSPCHRSERADAADFPRSKR